jgi:hypothetical protein
MSYETQAELKERMRRAEIPLEQQWQLFHPGMEPVKDFPNILVTFTSFEDWFNEEPAPQRARDIRATVQRFKIAETDYRAAVQDNIKALLKSGTGKAVLGEIAAAKKFKLSIRPYISAWYGGEGNATSDALVRSRSVPLGLPVRDSEGNKILSGHDLRGRPIYLEGTGQGTPAYIEFTPSMWGPRGSERAIGPGSLPDEVLLHEMVHSGRQMNAVQTSRRVTADYLNEEEFVAIVVSNIHMSEKKQTVFRATHAFADLEVPFVKLAMVFDVLPQPDRFLDNPQHMSPPPAQLLETVRTRQPNLWKAIKDIGPSKAKFNPIREWEVMRGKVLIDL